VEKDNPLTYIQKMRYKSLLVLVAAFICVPLFTYTYLKNTGFYNNNSSFQPALKNTDSIAEKSKPSSTEAFTY
jgi:hypothetical protein